MTKITSGAVGVWNIKQTEYLSKREEHHPSIVLV